MKRTTILVALMATLLALVAGLARAEPRRLSLTLQTRDAKSGQVILTTEQIDSASVGIVVVDPWNFHWCKTATMRVDALIPRMNKAWRRLAVWA